MRSPEVKAQDLVAHPVCVQSVLVQRARLSVTAGPVLDRVALSRARPGAFPDRPSVSARLLDCCEGELVT
jgi:hypothetical protein